MIGRKTEGNIAWKFGYGSFLLTLLLAAVPAISQTETIDATAMGTSTQLG